MLRFRVSPSGMSQGTLTLRLCSIRPEASRYVIVTATRLMRPPPSRLDAKKVSRRERSGFSSLITDYVLNREQLYYLFVLVDARHEPQRIDLAFIRFLGEHGVPFGIVFTKADKLSGAQLRRNVENYRKQLAEEWEELPRMFVTSSERGQGRDEILDFIENCLARN